ncbi:Peptide methionine sulfoxide reductase [Linum perenne]
MNILNKLGFGFKSSDPSAMDSTIPQSPDDDVPSAGQQFAQFGAGCFWGVELAFQRVSGVTKTEVGYSQGLLHNPSYQKAANESKERHQKLYNRNIVTEILPAKKFYRAEEYHQQYLAKGGRLGLKQSAEKGCNDPIRCYG